jgi:prephenate dehydratase
MRIGYLGPLGTFTHESAEMLALKHELTHVEFVPYPTSVAAVEAAAKDEVDAAVVADATSATGEMPEMIKVIDASGLKRLDHLQRVCHYHLFGMSGATLGGLKEVVAHAKATADCKGKLAELAPGLPLLNTPSTAAGVERVANEARADLAAIGTAVAGNLYGLVALAENIEDDPENWTRWVLLAKSDLTERDD